MILGLILTALRCWVLPWHMRRRQRLQDLQRMSKDESQASALGDPGPAAQSSTENEKNAHFEMQNGIKPLSTDDIKVEYDGLVNAEMGLIDGSRSNVAAPLPSRASISSNGDATKSVTTDDIKAEYDGLVNAELGLIDGSRSSVADPLPPHTSVSFSGDAHIVMTSLSEHDVLMINKNSSSNLVQANKITT